MKRLKVNRYIQEPSHCAVSAIATVTNYYNKNVDYNYVKNFILDNKIAKTTNEGLETGEICRTLNKLGFKDVTLVTSYTDVFDYTWEKYSKKKLIRELQIMRKKVDSQVLDNEEYIKQLLKWYTSCGYFNKIIIDYDFGKYIRRHLNHKKPVIVDVNWTMFHRFGKSSEKSEIDPYSGTEEEHCMAANGFDNKGVWVVDSHHEFYKYKRKKFRRGFYKISWENLMCVISKTGDVILPDNYN